MSAALVLSTSPLSGGFRAELTLRLGAEPDFLTLPALRRLPLGEVLRTLRRYAGRPCVVAFEDPASGALRPVLHTLATLARPSAVTAVEADGAEQPLRSRALPRALLRLGAASCAGYAAAVGERRKLGELLVAPRADAAAGEHGRVLYLNANLWFGLKAGGSVGHVAGVVNGLHRLGRRVELFSVADPVLVAEGVRFRRLHPPPVLGLPIELNYPRFQRVAVRQVLDASAGGYDFVYHRQSTASFAGVEIARRLGTRLVLEYNGSEVWVARNWGRPLRDERYALHAEEASLRHAHLVVTVSHVLRDELVGRGVAPDRIVSYPNGVDEAAFDPARFSAGDLRALRARYGIPQDAVVVGFIGTFGHWHGVEVLARTIVRLLGEADGEERPGMHFLLVGDGLRMPDVRRILADAPAQQRVTLTGLVPQGEGPLHLAACDILVSPHLHNDDGSRFFGSPTKLFEYMAMGKGIVASDLEQIGEVLRASLRARHLPAAAPGDREERLAVLAAPGDEGELAAGIRFLAEHPGWRAALGRNARREALSRYTWRHHVAAILDGLGGPGG